MNIKLSRKKQPRNILIANLATSLVLHGKIKTTLPKAKLVKAYVEKIISSVRQNTLATKRSVGSRLKDKQSVAKLFDIATKNIKQLPSSGIISIYKLGVRRGDGATVALAKINEELFKIEEIQSEEKNKEDKKEKIVNHEKDK